MNTVNGKIFKEMLASGCSNLSNQKKEVDARNVFPVPDGDTGTNMSLTFTNGMAEVNKSGSDLLPVVAKLFCLRFSAASTSQSKIKTKSVSLNSPMRCAMVLPWHIKPS